MARKHKIILLTGGSGTLGKAIQKSGLFSSLLAPSHRELDITDPASIEKYFQKHEFDAIIHCAAIARLDECEHNPEKALATNIVGTSNLVKAVLKKGMRFVHISTDGVYPGIQGNYKEKDGALPYNRYGWSKLGAECAVNLLSNFCIIRTGFFDPQNVKHEKSATDAFNCRMPVKELIPAIAFLVENNFIGTINVGGKRESDFNRYRKFKPALKPCKLKDILKNSDFQIYPDRSMNISLWKKIKVKRK